MGLWASWTNDPTGVAGSSPGAWNTANTTWTIKNGTTPTVATNIAISGTGSNIQVGDGTAAINFIIPTGKTVTTTSGTSVANNATLTLNNALGTVLGTLDPTSTVVYGCTTGGQTVQATTYGYLTISCTGETATMANIATGITVGQIYPEQ